MLTERGLRETLTPDFGDMRQVLLPSGELVEDVRDTINSSLATMMYENMLLTRTFDRKCINLQRQGRMGTYAPFEGQEAAQIGSAMALETRDWMFPTYRDHAATITRGQSMSQVMLYWQGRLEGAVGTKSLNILPPSVPIATHLLHAVGAAWATKLRGEDQVAIAYFGDGASSEGDFHEALNFAGVFQAPVIFFCQNNGYAISVPFHRQSASKTIAQRAVAYDMRGMRVDGNDVFAVYMAVSEARQRALAGEGPTLIEAVTFRIGAHTTADDPKKYRDQEAVALEWKEHRDPLKRLKLYLERQGLWDDARESEFQTFANQQVDAAVEEVMNRPAPNPHEMFDHVYADMPQHLKEQSADLERALKKDGMNA